MQNRYAIQKYHHWHVMVVFSFTYSTISWWKFANILYKVILNLFENNLIIIAKIYVSIDGLSIYFYSLYNNELIHYFRSLNVEYVSANWCISGPERYLIYYYCLLRYICQWLEFMNQQSCLRHNDERTKNIFYIQLPLHNTNHDKMHKYMFILLLHGLSWYFLVDIFDRETWNENFIYFRKCISGNMLFQKIIHPVEWLMIHISLASSLINNLWICTFFMLIFQTIRFKDVQLQWQQKYGFNDALYSLKRLISMEKIICGKWWYWSCWYKACD